MNGAQDALWPHAPFGIGQRHAPGQNDAGDGGIHGRVTVEEQIDEKNDGRHHVGAFQHAPFLGQLLGRQPLETVALGGQVDHDEDGGIVKQRRKDRGDDDAAERNVEKRRHHEGAGSHDRRHDLPAGTCHRFDRAREVRFVADALHERNGERPRAVHVGDGGTGDRTEKTGTDDGDFGGTAGLSPRKGLGEFHEIFADAAVLEKTAEDQEDHHQRRRNAQRGRVNALVGQVHLLDQKFEGAREPVAEIGESEIAQRSALRGDVGHHVIHAVAHKSERDENDGKPHGAAGRFDQSEDDDRAEDQLDRRDLIDADHALDDHVVVEHDIDAGNGGNNGEAPVVPWHGRLGLRRFFVFEHGIDDEDHRQDPCEVNRSLKVRFKSSENRGIKMKDTHRQYIKP